MENELSKQKLWQGIRLFLFLSFATAAVVMFLTIRGVYMTDRKFEEIMPKIFKNVGRKSAYLLRIAAENGQITEAIFEKKYAEMMKDAPGDLDTFSQPGINKACSLLSNK